MTYEKIYKELKKKVQKDFGNKCREFYKKGDCTLCILYKALNIIEQAAEWERESKK